MKIHYLFPYSFKFIGLIILIPSLILGALFVFFDIQLEVFNAKVPALLADDLFGPQKDALTIIKNNITDEIAAIGLIVGALFFAFSREKLEDEYIAKIRLESLVWAVYLNYTVLILCFLFIYNFSFLQVMLYNLFTILIFFILRYQWKKYQLKKQMRHEE